MNHMINCKLKYQIEVEKVENLPPIDAYFIKE
jgi:hypothetical protein